MSDEQDGSGVKNMFGYQFPSLLKRLVILYSVTAMRPESDSDGLISIAIPISYQNSTSGAWRGCPAVRISHCSCRRPKFCTLHPC